ncbi:hypothetical protein [Gracilibacillus kekensis]|uniref:Uncharacterized protein n=1 Tax=Gracilibacillus kekensis TaxID=1027249 RepID=A0A1M7J3J7_9BACI|nr:hypothetical protein [Gracilibacillus kekensis]SHM47556.1 hypothetical protein SAMN05216179_0240 [Gracilibacillus kekensis]
MIFIILFIILLILTFDLTKIRNQNNEMIQQNQRVIELLKETRNQ